MNLQQDPVSVISRPPSGSHPSASAVLKAAAALVT